MKIKGRGGFADALLLLRGGWLSRGAPFREPAPPGEAGEVTATLADDCSSRGGGRRVVGEMPPPAPEMLGRRIRAPGP